MVSLLRRTLNLMYWGPILRTSFDLDYLLTKFGSSGGGWGGADHNSVHSKILSFWSEDTHVCPVQFLDFQGFPTNFFDEGSCQILEGFPGDSDGKEYTCNAGDPGSIPRLGISHGDRNGCALQYSCLENSVDRGALWQATVMRLQRVGHLSN